MAHCTRNRRDCASMFRRPSPKCPRHSRSLTTHRRSSLNTIKLVAFALIVVGVLGLAYGSFSYTKDTTAVKLGPIELSVKEKETVNVPVWAGIGAIVVGGLLLVFGSKGR